MVSQHSVATPRRALRENRELENLLASKRGVAGASPAEHPFSTRVPIGGRLYVLRNMQEGRATMASAYPPEKMTPVERLDEVSRILARALARGAKASKSDLPAQAPERSLSETGLETALETGLPAANLETEATE